MREIEKRIQEKRSIEATKKKLMGFNGKLGCIVRNLGQPLISHSEGGSFHELGSGMEDPWAMEDDNDLEKAISNDDIMKRMPTMEVRDELGNPLGDPGDHSDIWSEYRERTNYAVDQIGWHFDGLSRGMHLEIKYEEGPKSLTASHQGYEVYREVAGELRAYSPHIEWEDKINRLYAVAEKMDSTRKEETKKEEIEDAIEEKDTWWEKTRKKWGL